MHGPKGHPKATWKTDSSIPKASAEPKTSKWARMKDLFSPRNSLSLEILSGGVSTHPSQAIVEEPNYLQVETAHLRTFFWPEDLLAQDFQNTRILTFGYNSEYQQFFGSVPQNNLYTLSKRLLNDLMIERASDVWATIPILNMPC